MELTERESKMLEYILFLIANNNELVKFASSVQSSFWKLDSDMSSLPLAEMRAELQTFLSTEFGLEVVEQEQGAPELPEGSAFGGLN
jgi:hypothetical protein